MKKFLLSCVFLIMCLQGQSQIFSLKDTYFMAFGYSHSVVHSSNPDNYSFNNITEYWCQVGPLEFTVYSDMTDYGNPVVTVNNVNHWNEYDYKDYTHNYREFQQEGYSDTRPRGSRRERPVARLCGNAGTDQDHRQNPPWPPCRPP